MAHSTFTSVNMWIWRIPTKYRNLYRSFQSSVQVDVASIIACYSGSQDALIVHPNHESVSDTFEFPISPLLCTETQFVRFDKKGGTRQIPIMSEYGVIKTSVIDEKTEKTSSWANVKHLQAHTENSVLEITVDSMAGMKNRSFQVIITGGTKEKPNLETITITVSQFEKLVD